MQKSTLIKHWKDDKIITNEKVINAFKKVRREDFVLKNYIKQAYEDIPLPLGWNATISQPTTVAIMTQALEIEETNKILEIGTGSGYQAAILSVLAKKGKIITTEINYELAEFANSNLKNFNNVLVIETDGSKGCTQESPYDRIIYTCAIPKIEQFILDQLKDPGILLAPVGSSDLQKLTKVRKENLQIKKEYLGYFQFVKLQGKFK